MSNASVTQDDSETNTNCKTRSLFLISRSINVEFQKARSPATQQMVHQRSNSPSQKQDHRQAFPRKTLLASPVIPKPTKNTNTSLIHRMCVDKEYKYQCGCIETDHLICMRNLDGPRFSRNCPQYRGVEMIVAEGSCQRHMMHPKPAPRVEGEGEGEREGSRRKGRCSACCPMM